MNLDFSPPIERKSRMEKYFKMDNESAILFILSFHVVL